MGKPLLTEESEVPVGRTSLENHHKMIRMRRLSDQIAQALETPPSPERYFKIKGLKTTRDEIRGTMEPLRLVYVKPAESYRIA